MNIGKRIWALVQYWGTNYLPPYMTNPRAAQNEITAESADSDFLN